VTALATTGRLTGAYLAVALVALLGGVLTGLAQALEHAGINVYPALAPAVQSYYHGLSLHGVLNVLVTCRGTRWCRGRRAAGCSATRWRGRRSCSSWCCPRRSVFTTSTRTPASTRAGSSSTRS